ncbi:GAF domain-like protein [Massariosphaeria phaeospora]|uniref:GAF domain-like protein n=1 Tax=Massariosphaeria phaeospora TaxID=100035 RepID=A0A7C8M729_9PLEO|nr:GAF domain-like protein [Massariosphaeria phaeospora]
MVHAEASTFAEGLSKKEVYGQVLEQAKALFEGQRNWVTDVVELGLVSSYRKQSDMLTSLTLQASNLANTASLLWHAFHSLPSPSNSVNWVGFYVLDPKAPQQLILGPFQGQVACQTIALGKGVCGTAAQSKRTQLVDNVDKFPGHIACDGATKSEIVVPVVKDGETVAIIDIDCAELNGFSVEDRVALEELAELLAESCDF